MSAMRLGLCIVVFAVLSLNLAGLKAEEAGSTDDGIAWEFQMPERLLAFGDLHGDLNGLVHMLIQLGVVSESDGSWIGGDTHVLLDGDLVALGSNSKGMLDFAMVYENELPRHKSALHTVLGNHDFYLAQGGYEFVSEADRANFEGFRHNQKSGFEAAMEEDSPYIRWLAQRNSLIKMGDLLFVHAGLDYWVPDFRNPQAVNYWIRQWMKSRKFHSRLHRQEGAPPASTDFLIHEGGPFENRRLSSASHYEGERMRLKALIRYMGIYNVSRLAIGHTDTREFDYRITLNHPQFGDNVIELDTGMGKPDGLGRLSALEMVGGQGPVAHYFEKPAGELKATKIIRARCAEIIQALARP